MKAAVPADKLKAVWESLPAQLGAAGKRGEASSSEANGLRVVVIPLHYARGDLQARVVLDKDDQVVGFLVQPAAPPPPAAPADAPFSEQDFTLPALASGKPGLPGTLTLPKGQGPFPALVLVHGSGAQDRNETAGPTAPSSTSPMHWPPKASPRCATTSAPTRARKISLAHSASTMKPPAMRSQPSPHWPARTISTPSGCSYSAIARAACSPGASPTPATAKWPA